MLTINRNLYGIYIKGYPVRVDMIWLLPFNAIVSAKLVDFPKSDRGQSWCNRFDHVDLSLYQGLKL